MKISILPVTRPGKWCLWLIIGFFLCFGFFQIMVASGYRGGVTFFSNPALSIPIILAAISGIASFIAGVIGIIFQREQGVLVFPAAFIGLFVLVFCLGEVISPH